MAGETDMNAQKTSPEGAEQKAFSSQEIYKSKSQQGGDIFAAGNKQPTRSQKFWKKVKGEVKGNKKKVVGFGVVALVLVVGLVIIWVALLTGNKEKEDVQQDQVTIEYEDAKDEDSIKADAALIVEYDWPDDFEALTEEDFSKAISFYKKQFKKTKTNNKRAEIYTNGTYELQVRVPYLDQNSDAYRSAVDFMLTAIKEAERLAGSAIAAYNAYEIVNMYGDKEEADKYRALAVERDASFNDYCGDDAYCGENK